MEGTAQQLESVIVDGMDCFTVNVMLKVLQSSWRFVLCVEFSVLQ